MRAGIVDEGLPGWPGPTKDELVAFGFHRVGNGPLPVTPPELMPKLLGCPPLDVGCWRKKVLRVGPREAARAMIAFADARLQRAIASSLAGRGPWVVRVSADGGTTFSPRGCVAGRNVGVLRKALPRSGMARQRRQREHRRQATTSGTDGDDGDGDSGGHEHGDGGDVLDGSRRRPFPALVIVGALSGPGELGRRIRTARRSARRQSRGVAALRSWLGQRVWVADAWSAIGVGG